MAFAGAVAAAGALSLSLPALSAGFALLGSTAAAAWVAITGPVGLIVGGLALITKAAYDLSPPFRDFLNTIPAALAEFWSDLVTDAKSAITTVKQEWERLVDAMNKAWRAFITPLTDTFAQAANVLKSIFESLGLDWQAFCDGFVEKWQQAVNTIAKIGLPNIIPTFINERIVSAFQGAQNNRKQVASTPLTRKVLIRLR